MTPIALTALVIALVLTVLVRVNRAPDFTIWGGVTLLAIVPVPDPHSDGWRIGVLSVNEALAGLANDGVVTIAAMFIVAAGLRETGALQLLVQNVLGRPKSVASAQHRVVWPTAALSGFFNNTPLVALLLPMTDDWAKRHAISISKLLKPLSFASILGGACTLIGTSTNLIVNGWLIDEAEHPGLGMFEITPVALPIAIVGIVFVVFGSRWLLPPGKRRSNNSAMHVSTWSRWSSMPAANWCQKASRKRACVDYRACF